MISFRQTNLIIEGFCVSICLLLFLYFYLDKSSKDKAGKWFFYMVLSNMLMLLGELTNWIFSGIPGAGIKLLLWIGQILYFGSSGFFMLSFMGYLMSFLENKTDVSKKLFHLGIFFACIQVIGAVTSPAAKAVLRLLACLIYAFCFYIIIKYRNYLKRKQMVLFLFCIILPVIAEIMQVITYKIAVLNMTITFDLLLIFIFIQSEMKLEIEKKENALRGIEMDHLENLQKHQEQLINQIITALSNTVEAKDVYTSGHSSRVANYSREIMFRLGGDETQQMDTYYMGLLHDVGKIRVPDSIINKNGRLTNEEYEQIKIHPLAGYHILKEVTIIPGLALGARWHHERYDGSGYPNGLSGENIPLIARIISVADAYDAMTSNRSYREIMPQQKVRQEIEQGMGTQFDPKIAQIMLDMIDEDIDYEMKQISSEYSKSILVIDDDETVFQFVQLALQDEDYMLTYADSGEEGIMLMQEESFDLVLLDVEMKGMNGFDVLKWIRENFRKKKVIFLTGEKEMHIIKQGNEMGINDYITKPIILSVMKESISNVLRH